MEPVAAVLTVINIMVFLSTTAAVFSEEIIPHAAGSAGSTRSVIDRPTERDENMIWKTPTRAPTAKTLIRSLQEQVQLDGDGMNNAGSYAGVSDSDGQILETCSVETHACQCVCESGSSSDDADRRPDSHDDLSSTATKATSIKIWTWELMCLRLERHTAAFEAETGIKVEIECVRESYQNNITRDQFHAEILSQAKTRTALYDGYTLGPHMFGDLDLVDGLHDLTPLIRNDEIGYLNHERDKDDTIAPWFDLDWNDIFLFQRENGAVYDRKVVGIPIDGDVHSLFYRTDLFERYNKLPPTTWDEYTELAKFFHGRQEPLPGGNSSDLVEISGSCVGIKERTEFWVFLILSSMTQHAGTSHGAFFDPRYGKRMEPLLGQAFVKTLQYMEQQFAYGADNEYNGNFKDVNLNQMNQGKCAMTYMWGDSFTEAAKAPPTSLIAGYLGTAPTPGSKYYLDRDTQQLQLCTDEVCSCGQNLSDGDTTPCINSAPYAAYTGWSMACSNFVSLAQKRACAEFAGYVSSPLASLADTIPNVTAGAPFIIVDPYRNSQTRLSEWVQRGLPEDSTREYLGTIRKQLSDTNVVLDMRIPGSAAFQSSMNSIFRRHMATLQAKKEAGLSGDDLLSDDEERWKVEKEIRKQWRAIIDNYDINYSPPLLEAYQRNLGIYQSEKENSDGAFASAGPIIGIVFAIFVVVGIFVVVFVLRERRRKNDDLWMIQKGEIDFVGVVVGRGRFGVVVLAEYKGTEVAVKHIMPEQGKTAMDTGTSPGYNTSSYFQLESWLPNDLEANAGGLSLPSKISTSSESSHESSGSIIKSLGLPRFDHKPKPVSRRQVIEDFKTQMRLLSRLRHPCIHTAVGAVVDPREDPLLVMEFMLHGSLYDLIHSEFVYLEGPMLLNILSDITQGMRFLHACKPQVIHCDLKASNILVDSRFRAKISDFGLPLSERSGAIGTPFWMAPELLKGLSSNTDASDVYAFGILVYEMFSGEEPYDGEDPGEVLRLVCDKAVNKRPQMPKYCPAQISSLMRDCVVYSPEERPTFVELDKRVKRVEEKDVLQSSKEVVRMGRDKFPNHIAKALQNDQKTGPEQHDMVTIMKSDIVDFETLSVSLEARKVASMLRRLYDKLDALTRKHDVFKLETIGDSYMAVANLVKEQPGDHAKRIIYFAMDAIDAAKSTFIDEEDQTRGHVTIRVGVHSGPVVADVVGSINPRYCLFGDTVNTSSRLESLSGAYRIHCSDVSARLLQVQDPSLPLVSRGLINVKNKGSIHTFWVNVDPNKENSTPITPGAADST